MLKILIIWITLGVLDGFIYEYNPQSDKVIGQVKAICITKKCKNWSIIRDYHLNCKKRTIRNQYFRIYSPENVLMREGEDLGKEIKITNQSFAAIAMGDWCD